MNIGYDAKRAFNNNSGLGNYSRSTIELFTKLYPDNNYILYTTKTGKFNPEDAPFINRKNTQTVLPDGAFEKKFSSYWRSYKLAAKAATDNINLFHGLSNELPHRFNNGKIKKVVTIHDLIFVRYPELYPFIDRKIYHSKFKHACKIADAIVAVSQQTKDDLVDFFGINDAKIKVVYQGCNPLYYKQKPQNYLQEVRTKYQLPSEYLLNVGTIEERKNALNIIKAVNRNKINIPVVIVGRPTAYIKSIHRYVRDNNMNNQVLFLHNVPLNDLPAIYQMASVFVYPSVFEGFGIPILEALNSKIPVITSRGSCFPEAGGDSSVYVRPNAPDELGFAIKNILQHPELAKKMIDEGVNHALKFREEQIAKKIMDVYKSVL